MDDEEALRRASAELLQPEDIALSADLCQAAGYLINFLNEVHNKPALFTRPVVQHAVQRYEHQWLPLIVQHPDEVLEPPLDVAWVWHCHMLAPRYYAEDTRNVSGAIPAHVLLPPDQRRLAREKARKLWESAYPQVPWEVQVDGTTDPWNGLPPSCPPVEPLDPSAPPPSSSSASSVEKAGPIAVVTTGLDYPDGRVEPTSSQNSTPPSSPSERSFSDIDKPSPSKSSSCSVVVAEVHVDSDSDATRSNRSRVSSLSERGDLDVNVEGADVRTDEVEAVAVAGTVTRELATESAANTEGADVRTDEVEAAETATRELATESAANTEGADIRTDEVEAIPAADTVTRELSTESAATEDDEVSTECVTSEELGSDDVTSYDVTVEEIPKDEVTLLNVTPRSDSKVDVVKEEPRDESDDSSSDESDTTSGSFSVSSPAMDASTESQATVIAAEHSDTDTSPTDESTKPDNMKEKQSDGEGDEEEARNDEDDNKGSNGEDGDHERNEHETNNVRGEVDDKTESDSSSDDGIREDKPDETELPPPPEDLLASIHEAHSSSESAEKSGDEETEDATVVPNVNEDKQPTRMGLSDERDMGRSVELEDLFESSMPAKTVKSSIEPIKPSSETDMPPLEPVKPPKEPLKPSTETVMSPKEPAEPLKPPTEPVVVAEVSASEAEPTVESSVIPTETVEVTPPETSPEVMKLEADSADGTDAGQSSPRSPRALYPQLHRQRRTTGSSDSSSNKSVDRDEVGRVVELEELFETKPEEAFVEKVVEEMVEAKVEEKPKNVTLYPAIEEAVKVERELVEKEVKETANITVVPPIRIVEEKSEDSVLAAEPTEETKPAEKSPVKEVENISSKPSYREHRYKEIPSDENGRSVELDELFEGSEPITDRVDAAPYAAVTTAAVTTAAPISQPTRPITPPPPLDEPDSGEGTAQPEKRDADSVEARTADPSPGTSPDSTPRRPMISEISVETPAPDSSTSSEEVMDKAGASSPMIYPDPSTDLSSYLPTYSESTSRINYNIWESVCRQKMFLYQVSLPHYKDQQFLQECLDRYKKFLCLKLQNPQSFLVPTYSLDLIWHVHQLHPKQYEQDTVPLYNHILNHDDSVNDRSRGSRLCVSQVQTERLWKREFRERFPHAGGMYRGVPPELLLVPFDSSLLMKSCLKGALLDLEKLSTVSAPNTVKHQYIRLEVSAWPERGFSDAVVVMKGEHPLSLHDSKHSYKHFFFDIRNRRGLHFTVGKKSSKSSFLSCSGSGSNVLGEKIVAFRQRVQDAVCGDGRCELEVTVPLESGGTVKVKLHGSIHSPEVDQLNLKVVSGEYEECMIATDDTMSWGPIYIKPLKTHVEPKCYMATHILQDSMQQCVFSVRVIHSQVMSMSAVQVYSGDNMTAVGHLIDKDQLPYKHQLYKPDAIPNLGEQPSTQRAMLVKGSKGDYGILLGSWVNMKNASGGLSSRGKPGYLSLRFYHLDSGRWLSVAGRYEFDDFKLQLLDVQVDLKTCKVVIGRPGITSLPRSVPEKVALAFCMMVMHVLCQPRPKLSSEAVTEARKKHGQDGEWRIAPSRGIASHELPLALAAGFLLPTPCTTFLQRRAAGLLFGGRSHKKREEDSEGRQDNWPLESVCEERDDEELPELEEQPEHEELEDIAEEDDADIAEEDAVDVPEEDAAGCGGCTSGAQPQGPGDAPEVPATSGGGDDGGGEAFTAWVASDGGGGGDGGGDCGGGDSGGGGSLFSAAVGVMSGGSGDGDGGGGDGGGCGGCGG